MASRVIVIGGGPGGMMAAGIAAQRGRDVWLIERNKRVGKKLLITGKGRCNVTNAENNVQKFIENIPVNGNFMYSSLSRFGSEELIKFFQQNGVKLKEERGARVFPESDKSEDILRALESFMDRNRVRIVNGDVDQILIENNAVKGVFLNDDTYYEASSVIVATGGMSYPSTGSKGDGYWFAKQAGHRLIKPKPSLIPLESPDPDCKRMQGLGLRNVNIKVLREDGAVEYEDFGEMLFTHFGLSGPIILSASAHIRDFSAHEYTVSVDLKPALDEDTLTKRLQSDFSKAPKSDFSNSLGGLFPRKMIPVIVERSGIPADQKCAAITKEQRHNLMKLIKDLRFEISKPRPIDEAIITSGGVDTKEINPATMESKLVGGLFFAGEVIDVDAYTGGFNLQIAFSTGYAAGENAK